MADVSTYDFGTKKLGAWVDKSSSYAAQQAATDGFVLALYGSGGSFQGYTDANSNPTTVRAVCGSAGDANSKQIMFPVRKGDYWKVDATPSAVYWLPLGAA